MVAVSNLVAHATNCLGRHAVYDIGGRGGKYSSDERLVWAQIWGLFEPRFSFRYDSVSRKSVRENAHVAAA